MTNHRIVCLFIATAAFAAIAAEPAQQVVATASIAPPVATVATPQADEEPWAADTSAEGTRPDFAH